MAGGSGSFLGGGVSGVRWQAHGSGQGHLVLKDAGKAITLEKNEAITLKFMWTNEDGRELMSAVNAKHDGTFVVQGPQNKGLPPGDYKISVKWNIRTVNEEPGIDTEKIVFKDEDRLEGVFDKDKTPLKITIDRGGVEELVIDVGSTPSVTKK